MREPGVYFLLGRAEGLPAEEDDGSWLSAGELRRCRALRPRRRLDWRLGRLVAKRALRLLLGTEAPALTELSIEAAPDGAPFACSAGRPLPLALSLSHREGVALCVLAPAGSALGCDLERVEPRSRALAEDFFTGAERQAIAKRAGADEQAFSFLAALVWSAKESCLKALRTGLRRDTRSVEVSLRGGAAPEGWELLEVTDRETDSMPFSGWWRASDGFILTVVGRDLPGPPRPLRDGDQGWLEQ